MLRRRGGAPACGGVVAWLSFPSPACNGAAVQWFLLSGRALRAKEEEESERKRERERESCEEEERDPLGICTFWYGPYMEKQHISPCSASWANS